MIKLAITGCMGRMGQKIYALAKQDGRFEVTCLLEHPKSPKIGEKIDGIEISADTSTLKGCEVIIDFSLPDGTLSILDACVENNVAMVIGTTGFTVEQANKIKEAAKSIPIIFATNMSIGVNVLFKVTELVSKKLAKSTATDVAIYEEHHCHKKDAPSGTAKTLGEIVEVNSGQKVRFDPEPLREGEIIGNHEVTFETNFDVLKLYHHAKDRNMFALGSLEGAAYLGGKENGLYNMQQVLGLDNIKID